MHAQKMQKRACLQRAARCLLPAAVRPVNFKVQAASAAATSNGASASPAGAPKTHRQAPSPAETARTVIAICHEGTLCTLSPDGTPIGTAVSFTKGKEGQTLLELAPGSVELHNLAKDQRCSLQIQPVQFPARAVGSVTLVGKLQPSSEHHHQLEISKCLYFGGLDQQHVEVSSTELQAAEPDALRDSACELIRAWNDERAEDIYRIVSGHLKIPIEEMSYAELLWLDYLGMYVRVEAEGIAPGIVRVPFYRPVTDERDVRSVLTMAAQVAWEQDRPYVPPVPAAFTDAAAAANN